MKFIIVKLDADCVGVVVDRMGLFGTHFHDKISYKLLPDICGPFVDSS